MDRRGLATNPRWTFFFLCEIDEAVKRRGLTEVFRNLGPADLDEVLRRLELEDEEVVRRGQHR